MDEREYLVPLPGDAMLRIHYLKDRGRILKFAVQLVAYIDGEWVPIVRYDTAHDFVHRDDLRPDGTQVKSPPMAFASRDDAMNYAIRDLRTNYELYVERYRRWRS